MAGKAGAHAHQGEARIDDLLFPLTGNAASAEFALKRGELGLYHVLIDFGHGELIGNRLAPIKERSMSGRFEPH